MFHHGDLCAGKDRHFVGRHNAINNHLNPHSSEVGRLTYHTPPITVYMTVNQWSRGGQLMYHDEQFSPDPFPYVRYHKITGTDVTSVSQT